MSQTAAVPAVPAFTAATAPGALPLLGHGHRLLSGPVDFLSSLHAHGDLVAVRLGPTTAQVPCHPALLARVLGDDRLFDKGGVFYDRARDVAGNGLVTCPYGDHRRQRRLVQSAFRRSQLAHYAGAAQAEVDAAAADWRPGLVVDAFPLFYGIALRTLARTLYSTAISAELAAGVERSFDTVLNGLFRQMFLPAPVRRLPLPANLRYRRSLAYLHAATRQLITSYRSERGDRGDRTPGDEGATDLLSALLDAVDEEGGGSGLSDAEVHDQVITLLAAGTETVAATLTWALWRLSLHPAAAEQVRAELAGVLPGGRPPTPEDLPRLAAVDRVLSETLRLHPPGWLFTRLTTAPTELAGRELPPGTTLVFSPAAVSRHPAAYDSPAVFDPDRWRPERVTPAARQAFLPFGTGARKCVGDLFARTECAVALATLLSRWRFTPEPDADLRPVPLATVLRPRRLRLRVAER
ncbi:MULTISPECIES: cytochrome P450 [Kitasatospora]|uniref:Putative cytochrome P450 n=1 Tax=Kitasatospora setae (strain ATCC 33774 / DSM 43861 / JCM 3304 / KCC A-0304 / NBRC 14216 / KM-6054) TaxID=452652 RepID=E4N4S6_KITSK|nr:MULTISPECIES: cytochrome P450 [Kitasatospora]BAJ26207.1 putative cytochrome P450 [Kitasatospora setae KM-6054]